MIWNDEFETLPREAIESLQLKRLQQTVERVNATVPFYRESFRKAGITPAEPGFRSVNISPAPGSLEQINAAVPHPAGIISLQLERRGKEGIRGSITLPEGLQGTFNWGINSVPLVSGTQEIKL